MIIFCLEQFHIHDHLYTYHFKFFVNGFCSNLMPQTLNSKAISESIHEELCHWGAEFLCIPLLLGLLASWSRNLIPLTYASFPSLSSKEAILQQTHILVLCTGDSNVKMNKNDIKLHQVPEYVIDDHYLHHKQDSIESKHEDDLWGNYNNTHVSLTLIITFQVQASKQSLESIAA